MLIFFTPLSRENPNRHLRHKLSKSAPEVALVLLLLNSSSGLLTRLTNRLG